MIQSARSARVASYCAAFVLFFSLAVVGFCAGDKVHATDTSILRASTPAVSANRESKAPNRANRQEKPVYIGLTSYRSEEGIVVPDTYIHAVERAGGIPVALPVTDSPKELDALLAMLDALVFTGGEDVDPAVYHESAHPKLETVSRERDACEILLLKKALARRIPILGICRGHQLIAAALGGTLYQDIPSQCPSNETTHRLARGDRWALRHPIKIDRDSRLFRVLGRDSFEVNSCHHQSVRQCPPNARIVARTPDGGVESIEYTDHPELLCIQWHPERALNEDDGVMLRLFTWLVEQGRRQVATVPTAKPRE